MQKFSALLILAVFLLGVGAVFAQDTDVEIVEVPDVLVICPGEGVLESIRAAAALVGPPPGHHTKCPR